MTPTSKTRLDILAALVLIGGSLAGIFLWAIFGNPAPSQLAILGGTLAGITFVAALWFRMK